MSADRAFATISSITTVCPYSIARSAIPGTDKNPSCLLYPQPIASVELMFCMWNHKSVHPLNNMSPSGHHCYFLAQNKSVQLLNTISYPAFLPVSLLQMKIV